MNRFFCDNCGVEIGREKRVMLTYTIRGCQKINPNVKGIFSSEKDLCPECAKAFLGKSYEMMVSNAEQMEKAKENANKPIPGTTLETELWKLPINARAVNCMVINGYRTIGELLNLTENEIKIVRGIGVQSLEELLKVQQIYAYLREEV